MNYPSIRIEGGILSPDIFDRLDDAVGQQPADFGLESSAKVKDEIARAWADAQDYWRIFQRKLESLKAESPATTETRNNWIVPLLGLIGYQLEYQARGTELNGKNYPLSHRVTNKAQTPVHIIGYHEPSGLDRKPEKSALRMSAHALVQEYLNLTDQLYALATNGRVLRLLRDSSRLVKLSYLEFDLDRIFSDGLFADFAMLYRLLHASRLPQSADAASSCWLERYHQDTIEQGTRIREGLRAAVTEALEILGTGFLANRGNTTLQRCVASGELKHDAYFTHILRLVYRLLFLMVAEERGLIFPKGTASRNISIYFQHYSVQRLRRLAVTRGLKIERFHDAWLSLLSTFRLFEHQETATKLGMSALGGKLFHPESLGPLSSSRLSNAAFFAALDRLCYFNHPKSGQRMPVNFGALATEEFGSVYESLLELHPIVEVEPAPQFRFKQAGGNDRRTSGSYYTQSNLVSCLLDCALDPLLEDRIQNFASLGFKTVDESVLALKVCDSACGSGHFLIAAAQRIARRLAIVRAGDEEPGPELLRHTLREVISHCIYGVDLNPMAVELCKVALWLEALEPGKPLSFLDHHIQCGNSLFGATPAFLAKGIPEAAFTAIEGDVKTRVSELKATNRREKLEYLKGQGYLFEPYFKLGNMTEEFAKLSTADDDSTDALAAKEALYTRLVRDASYQSARLWADLWCASFAWRKDDSDNGKLCPTERVFRSVERNPFSLLPHVRQEVERLRDHYGFFHWHLAFPDVFRVPVNGEKPENEHGGWNGGFDLMLGNPPWDTLSPDAKEFFAAYDVQVRFQDRDGQQRIIEGLLQNPDIAARWEANCRDLYALVHFIKQSGRYLMFAPGNLGKGDFNVYRMFVETALSQTRKDGWAAQVVPEGLYNGANCMAIRRALFETCRLNNILGFENANEVWFTNIDTRMKFCIYAAQVGGQTESFLAAFNIRSHDQLAQVLRGRCLQMPVRLVKEFSPDAIAIMELGNQHDIDIAAKMYHWPAFGDQTAGPPTRVYMREIDMGNDRDLFSEDPSGVPLYEGRMVDQFDHRAKGYRSGRGRAADWEDLPFSNPNKSTQSQWHIAHAIVPDKCRERIQRFRLGFCDVASPTNERTLVVALIPPNTICGHKVPTICFQEGGFDWYMLVWMAVANSYSMDFVARKKVSLSLAYTILDSFPFPRLDRDDQRARSLVSRSLRLTCTGPEMVAFWNTLAAEGWVPATTTPTEIPGETNEEARLQLQAEIDAIVARDLFNLTRSELEYILATFPTQKRYQEERYGEFRSRRLILECFDRLPT